MKKLIIFCLLATLSLSAEPYRINGVREFHRTVKNFIAQSTKDKIKKLNETEIVNLTIQLSSIVLLVDELTDNDYLQGVLSSIEAYEDYLANIEENSTDKTTALSYLSDIKKDMISQNKSDLNGGTRAYKFDIEAISADDLPLYEIKKEIQKGGPKTLEKYISSLTMIDADIIQRANELKISELVLNHIFNPSAEEIEALLLFKGNKITFPVLCNPSPEALTLLAKFSGVIEFNRLIVDDELLNILTTFKASELKITGLNSEYGTILAEKLGKSYKKKILFKKRKKL